jgi:hypothetical protein
MQVQGRAFYLHKHTVTVGNLANGNVVLVSQMARSHFSEVISSVNWKGFIGHVRQQPVFQASLSSNRLSRTSIFKQSFAFASFQKKRLLTLISDSSAFELPVTTIRLTYIRSAFDCATFNLISTRRGVSESPDKTADPQYIMVGM